jgi:hypothetical protein
MNPILEPLHRFIVLLRDLRLDLSEIVWRRPRLPAPTENYHRHDCRYGKVSPIHAS